MFFLENIDMFPFERSFILKRQTIIPLLLWIFIVGLLGLDNMYNECFTAALKFSWYKLILVTWAKLMFI